MYTNIHTLVQPITCNHIAGRYNWNIVENSIKTDIQPSMQWEI
jgi:hypothetical protein